MLGRFRAVSNELWPLLLAVGAGCAEAAIDDEMEFEVVDSAIVADTGSASASDAAQSLDTSFEWPDASTLVDSSVGVDSATGLVDAGIDAGKADAGSDAGSPKDAGVDASTGVDAGPRDAGADASAPDAGKADASTPDAGMCKQENCKNDCSLAAPFRCCQSDGQCGCSWVSGIYCN